MKRIAYLILPVVLFVLVSAVQGQTPTTAVDYYTLAAAYAETGNFEGAIKWENKALSFPEFAKSYGDEARKRLHLYTERKPYHESPSK